MPPKKKLDPEALHQQFEAYKETEEYKKWVELSNKSKEFEVIIKNLTETTRDLFGPWPEFLDELFKFFQIVKVKVGKLKKFEHEHFRSFFFALADQEEKPKQVINTIQCGVSKEHADRSYRMRHSFIEFYNIIKEIDQLNFENYQTQKKTMTKAMTDFIKLLQTHIKSGHKEIYEQKLMKVIEPLNNLIQSNFAYVMFNINYKDETSKEVCNFKQSAIIEKYCITIAEVFRMLHDCTESKDPKIVTKINMHLVFNKLRYKGWREKLQEKLYLQELEEAFDKVQKRLFGLACKGVSFWRFPIEDNTELVEDLDTMINCELIAERLLGTQLKRDQMEFIYKTMELISNANQTVKDNMLKKDENSTQVSIPRLIIFTTILHMRKWKDRKAYDEQQLLEEKKKQEEKLRALNPQNEPLSPIKHSQTQPLLLKNQTQIQPKSPETKTALQQGIKTSGKIGQFKYDEQILEEMTEEEKKKQEEIDYMKYGRYWIWDNYVSPQKKEVFEQLSELLRHINPAVLQDIQDLIIKEGFIPKKKKRHDEEATKASKELEEMSKKEFSDKDTIDIRPPILWNYPKVLDQHQFRTISDPKKCYIDGRYEELEQKMIELTEHFQTENKAMVKELIDRNIDVFRNQYNKEVNTLAKFQLEQ